MLPVPSATPTPLTGVMQPVVSAPLDDVAELQDSAVVAADLISHGSALQFAGACADAIPLYEQAIALEPGFSNVYAVLALCLYDQGRIDEAIARWQEALQRDLQSPDALAGLGTALYIQGQQEAGLALYRQAVDLDPRYADEAFLREDSFWGGSAIFDSRVLRRQLTL